MSADPVVDQLAAMRRAVHVRLAQVRTTVAVFSGKGGVGKSTVAACLALAFAEAGLRVGLVDADLTSPAVDQIFGLPRAAPRWVDGRPAPWEGPHGALLFSLGAMLPARTAPLAWRGPPGTGAAWRGVAARSVLREIVADVQWGELDYLLFDLPPGTDLLEDLAGLLEEVDLGLAVSTESALARSAVQRSIARAGDVGVRVVGVVENMFGRHQPGPEPDAPVELGAPVVARIPYDNDFAARVESGRPELILRAPGGAAAALRALADRLMHEQHPNREVEG